MREKFSRYNLELEEVLIGTPGSSSGDSKIEQILTQLRARQIAEEQIETYNRQEKAAVKERELREAESREAATGAHRIGDRYYRAGQPGQGRLSARAPAGGHYSGAGRGRRYARPDHAAVVGRAAALTIRSTARAGASHDTTQAEWRELIPCGGVRRQEPGVRSLIASKRHTLRICHHTPKGHPAAKDLSL